MPQRQTGIVAPWLDTPEKIRRFSDLWNGVDANGTRLYSVREICILLCVTKNQVVGITSRNPEMFTPRQSPIRRGDIPSPIPPPRFQYGSVTLPQLESVACDSGDTASCDVGHINNDNCCAFIQDPGFSACGKPTVRRMPYCDEHCAVAYVSFRPRDLENDAAD